MKRLIGAVLLVTAAVAAPAIAAAADVRYPVRPVRIVTGDIGGAPDIAARLMTPALTEALGQQVIVENRGGANGMIAAQTAARASPDGHSLLFYAGALWLSPIIDGTKEDPLKELTPVSMVGSSPNVLVVHPSVPVKSVNELIALAKSRPGQLNYGSGGVGSSPYLGGELFKAMAGVDVVRVNYKGGGPAVADLVGGQLQFMFATASSSATHISSGRLRAIAVTSPKPSALAPGLPTVAASGLAGFETQGYYALFAPVGTPPSTVALLQRQVRQVVHSTSVKEKLLNAGIEPIGSTAGELAAALKDEMTRWGKLFQKIRK